MSRPGVAAQALGIAQGALELAVKYVRERVQFGKPISTFQGIQWMLADMATEVEAARGLVYSTARKVSVKSVCGDIPIGILRNTSGATGKALTSFARLLMVFASVKVLTTSLAAPG